MLKRILFAAGAILFAACSSHTGVEATRDSLMQTMDTQRSAVSDSVASKAEASEQTIDSAFKVLQDSVQSIQ